MVSGYFEYRPPEADVSADKTKHPPRSSRLNETTIEAGFDIICWFVSACKFLLDNSCTHWQMKLAIWSTLSTLTLIWIC